MGKNKRLKAHSHAPKKHKLNTLTRPSGISKSHSAKPQSTPPKPKPKHHHQPSQHLPTIPFHPSDHILLIGEGDLSFARSLLSHHACTNVTATVYESEAELRQKYPHVGENIAVIEGGGSGGGRGRVRYGVDAARMRVWDGEGREGNAKGERAGGVDRVVFNFPHVGGKTKDVNRQVRFNQELLVSFFKRAIPSLSPKKGSSIIVTLFEGEPYTLWNIRDLARHSGLEVQQSFVFQASAYPGYRHARTLGVVKGKNGEVGGGWKGEERKARSFVFVRKGEGVKMGPGKKGKVESSDDEDEDEEEEEDAELDSEHENGHSHSDGTEDDFDDNDTD